MAEFIEHFESHGNCNLFGTLLVLRMWWSLLSFNFIDLATELAAILAKHATFLLGKYVDK